MEFIILELDEERILKDGITDLRQAKEIIADTFRGHQCFLFGRDGGADIWTRDSDEKDYEILWEIQAAFRKERWFRYYVKRWEYIEADEAMKRIEVRENIIEDWASPRPERP